MRFAFSLVTFPGRGQTGNSGGTGAMRTSPAWGHRRRAFPRPVHLVSTLVLLTIGPRVEGVLTVSLPQD